MRLWYPDRTYIEIVRYWIAADLFPGYAGGPPARFFGVIAGAEGEAALDSALSVIKQRFYPRLFDKAGALLRSLIKNIPLLTVTKG